MEKIEKNKIVIEEINHKFYCDDCNKYLGESSECDDGYYEEYGRYEQKMYVAGCGWYKLETHLCDKCKVQMDKKIVEKLKELGFKED